MMFKRGNLLEADEEPDEPLPVLPPELWLYALGFVSRLWLHSPAHPDNMRPEQRRLMNRLNAAG